jgi:hypothetical protein
MFPLTQIKEMYFWLIWFKGNAMREIKKKQAKKNHIHEITLIKLKEQQEKAAFLANEREKMKNWNSLFWFFFKQNHRFL